MVKAAATKYDTDVLIGMSPLLRETTDTSRLIHYIKYIKCCLCNL